MQNQLKGINVRLDSQDKIRSMPVDVSTRLLGLQAQGRVSFELHAILRDRSTPYSECKSKAVMLVRNQHVKLQIRSKRHLTGKYAETFLLCQPPNVKSFYPDNIPFHR